MGFVSDLALAFIAFGVGKFFKKEVILRTGKRIIIITIFEALTAEEISVEGDTVQGQGWVLKLNPGYELTEDGNNYKLP